MPGQASSAAGSEVKTNGDGMRPFYLPPGAYGIGKKTGKGIGDELAAELRAQEALYEAGCVFSRHFWDVTHAYICNLRDAFQPLLRIQRERLNSCGYKYRCRSLVPCLLTHQYTLGGVGSARLPPDSRCLLFVGSEKILSFVEIPQNMYRHLPCFL